MDTSMPIFNELAGAAGSTYVNVVMIEKFQREMTSLKADEVECTKKAQQIRARIAERDLLLEELQRLFPFESTVKSITALNSLQMHDLKEASEMLAIAMQKKTRQAQVAVFIEGLKGLPY